MTLRNPGGQDDWRTQDKIKRQNTFEIKYGKTAIEKENF